MDATEIFKPLVIQAGLMVFLTYWLAWARIGSIARGKVKQADVAKHGWQGWIKNAGDNYSNQYEMPILFFVVGILLYLSQSVTPLVLGLAWFFVATRIFHALIHISKNIIPLRALVFFIGGITLTAMYVLLAMAVF